MNIHRNPFFRIVAICLVGATSLFASCDKSENTPGGIDAPDSNAQYVLQPGTIRIEPFGGSTPATRAAVAIKEESHSFNTGVEQGNVITLGNSEVEATPATRALAPGTYYRIVVYKQSEYDAAAPKILTQRLCKTGTTEYFGEKGDSTEPIYLISGDYCIFCYSFNKTTPEGMDPLTNGAVSVLLVDGDDFLSADIIKQKISSDVSLGTITLKHRCCRLEGVLATADFTPAGIASSDPNPSLSVSGTFTIAGAWSIKEPGFTASFTNAATKEFSLSESESGDTSSGTLILLPLTNQSLSTTYAFKPKPATVTYAATDALVSKSVSFSTGGSYAFTVTAVKAYVVSGPTSEGYVEIGNIKWAYANLKAGSPHIMESNPWESGHQRSDGTLTNDYWRWNTVDVDISSDPPAEIPATWDPSTDPCRKIGDSWKVPEYTELVDLKGRKLVSKKVYIKGVTAETNANGFVVYETMAGCVFADDTNGTCIFLPAAGYRSGSRYVLVGTEEGEGYYWSATLSPINNVIYASCLNFASGYCSIFSNPPTKGYSLRCVHK